MSKNKDQISSPFENQLLDNPGDGAKKGDVVDHNVCPYFSKPREHEAGLPEVFFSAVDGDTYHGEIGKKAAKISGTMGGRK
jgi:hypothetical protein